MANTNKYASVADTTARYATPFLIRLTNFTNVDAGTIIIESRIENALLDASDIIDGYLSGRYIVPVSPAPDFFISDCVKLAVKLMLERKGYEPESTDANHVTAGNEIIKKYEKVAAGTMSLGIPDGSGASVPPAKVLSSSPARVFSSATLDKY